MLFISAFSAALLTSGWADEFADTTGSPLEQYSIFCHGETKKKGDITLHDLP